MNNLDLQYLALLQDILDNGVRKSSRTGVDTISVFGRTIRHKMSEGFPILTTKKVAWKQIVTELLWFLRGETNIQSLVKDGNNIWVGDAYKAYEKYCKSQGIQDIHDYDDKETFIKGIKENDRYAKRWGEMGPIYGKQWRNWTKMNVETKPYIHKEETHFAFDIDNQPIDQIANLINDLKTNPDSRRLMVSAWNVEEIDQMLLPPCHYAFQCYTRELSWEEREKITLKKYPQLNEQPSGALIDSRPFSHEFGDSLNMPTRAISLMWNQRSVDTPLGLPFNIASYGLLLEIIAKEVNMVPDELIGVLGDTHIYINQIDGIKEQLGRELTIDERFRIWFDDKKPNRDWVDHYDELSKEEQVKWLGKFGIPKRTRESYDLPKLNIKLHFENKPSFVPEQWVADDFELVNYKSHPKIEMPLSN